jgi:predicted transposase YdaD
LKIIRRLLALNLPIELIAQAVDLKVEQVNQFLERSQNPENPPDPNPINQ